MCPAGADQMSRCNTGPADLPSQQRGTLSIAPERHNHMASLRLWHKWPGLSSVETRCHAGGMHCLQLPCKQCAAASSATQVLLLTPWLPAAPLLWRPHHPPNLTPRPHQSKPLAARLQYKAPHLLLPAPLPWQHHLHPYRPSAALPWLPAPLHRCTARLPSFRAPHP